MAVGGAPASVVRAPGTEPWEPPERAAVAAGGPYPSAPPVRDTASPLTAQRLDVIYPNGAGPKARPFCRWS